MVCFYTYWKGLKGKGKAGAGEFHNVGIQREKEGKKLDYLEALKVSRGLERSYSSIPTRLFE